MGSTIMWIIAAVALVSGAGAGAFAAAYRCRQREATQRAEQSRALAAAMAYFQRSEVPAAGAVNRLADGRLVLLVEAEPLQKFRYSYIIEESLRKYVFKATGISLDRVFWRFTAKKKAEETAPQPAAVPAAASPGPSPAPAGAPPTAAPARSPAEEILAARQVTDYEISEDSWENYETAMRELAGTDQASH